MCFSKFALGGSDCDYNVSIFAADDGRALGRRWVRGNPSSTIDSITREDISQILLRTDGDFAMLLNVRDYEVFGSHLLRTAQVAGSRIVWSGPKFAQTPGVPFSGYNPLALLSGDRTVSYYEDVSLNSRGIICLDADGNTLWDTPEPASTTLYPSICSDGADIFASLRPNGDALYAVSYSGADGTEQWRAILGNPLSDGSWPIGAVDGDVFATRGEPSGNIWRFDSSGNRVGSGVVGGGWFRGARRAGNYVWGAAFTTPSIFVGDLDLSPIVSIYVEPDLAGFGFAQAVFVNDSGVYAVNNVGTVIAYELDGTFRWWNKTSTAFYGGCDLIQHDDRVFVVHGVIPGEFAPPPFPE